MDIIFNDEKYREHLLNSFQKESGRFWSLIGKYSDDSFHRRLLKKLFMDHAFEDHLDAVLKSGGATFWDLLSNNQIEAEYIKALFSETKLKKRLLASLVHGGPSFWEVVSRGLINKDHIRQLFNDPELRIHLFTSLVFNAKIFFQGIKNNKIDVLLLSRLTSEDFDTEIVFMSKHLTVSEIFMPAALVIGEIFENKKMPKGFRSGIPKIFKKLVSHKRFNEAMRFVNLFHHDNLHKDLRKDMLQSISVSELLNLVDGGVDEIFTSTSSFLSHILPIIFNEIKKEGGFNDFVAKQGLENQDKQLLSLLEVISRHGYFQTFIQHSVKRVEDAQTVKQILLKVMSQAVSSKDITTLLTTMVGIQKLSYPGGPLANYSFLKQDMEDALKFNFNNENNTKKRNAVAILSKLYIDNVDRVDAEKFSDSLPTDMKNKIQEIGGRINSRFEFKGSEISQEIKGGLTHGHFTLCVEGGDRDGEISCRTTINEIMAIPGSTKTETSIGVDGVKATVTKIENKRGPTKTVSYFVTLKKSQIEKMLPEVIDFVGEEGLQVNSFAYRGHSTYVPDVKLALEKTNVELLNTVFQDMKILFLGSCGGTSAVEIFQDFFESIEWVYATSQTGTTDVNNPAMFTMLQTISKLKTSDVWTAKQWERETLARVKNPSKFAGYQFPHNNFAAMVARLVKQVNSR